MRQRNNYSDKMEKKTLTSASHAVPFPDCFCHLLSDVDTVSMEPLITIVTASVAKQM